MANGEDCKNCKTVDERTNDKPMNCLFCGSECEIDEMLKCFAVACTKCTYLSKYCREKSEAIAEHNKRCKAWLAYKESEVK